MPDLAKMARVAGVVLLAAAAGCASKYVPSERMKSIQGSLDKAEAARIVARALAPSPGGAGLCKAPFGFDDPKPAATPDGFTVQAWKAGEEIGRKKEGGRTVVSYRKDRYVEERSFGAISKIRVTRDARGMCAGPVPPGLVAITLHGGGGISIPIVVAVAQGDLDPTLAALALLAPKAAIVEGAGL